MVADLGRAEGTEEWCERNFKVDGVIFGCGLNGVLFEYDLLLREI